MTCAKCGQALAPGARFCPACGTPSAAPAGGRPREFHVVGDVMQAVVVPLADGQEMQAEPGALLYMAGGVDMESRMSGGLFGGEGFILEKLTGAGSVFIHAGGNLIEFDLLPGQSMRVDTGCIVAFEETVAYDIQFVGGFKNALFGGEGLFLATLTGPGQAILQTLPFSRLVGRILGLTKEGTGGVSGVGGTLRDIGNILGGD